MSRKATLASIILALLCAAAQVSAATFNFYVWDGSKNTDWTDHSNWTSAGTGHPGQLDGAQFNGAPANMPSLATAASISELNFVSTAVAFTLSGVGGNLTIFGNAGVGVLNASVANPQTINIDTITLGASQTWNNAGTLNLGGTTLNLGTSTLTVAGAGTTTIGNAITGTGALTQSGTGTLNLNNAGNSYSGATTVSAGTLSFGAAQTLAGQVNLNGGALTVNNTGANSLGALVVNSASTLNLPASGTVTFASADAPTSSILTINGWQGTAGSSGSGAQIFLTGGATANFLSSVTFTGFAQGGALIGSNELVPVPEPQVYAAVFAIGLLGFALARRRMLVNA